MASRLLMLLLAKISSSSPRRTEDNQYDLQLICNNLDTD